MAYTSVSAVKRYLGIPAATTDDDVLIAEFIDAAQADIDSARGLTFEATSETARTFDAVADVDGPVLYIDYAVSITSITNGDGTTVTSGQYVTEPRREAPYYAIRLLSSAGVSWTYTTDPENAISITAKWAYTATPSAQVAEACVELVKFKYLNRNFGTSGYVPQADNVNSISYREFVAGVCAGLPRRMI